MSITWNELDSTSYFWSNNVKRAEHCFFCGHRLAYPVIGWMGHGSDLVMHHHCALSLCIRLIRDVHEVECKIGDFNEPSYLELAKKALQKRKEGTDGVDRKSR